MKGLKNWSAALMAAAVLTACGGGGGGGSSTEVAAADFSAGASPTLASALVGSTFTFPGGVPGLGTATDTTLSWTAGGDTPAFSIAADGKTATGTTTFGSCIFAVTASTFPLGHPLAVGQTVRVDPCNVNVAVAGAVANGVAQSRSIALALGAASSTKQTIDVGVTAGGQLTIRGNAVGTVSLTPVTG